MDLMSIIVMSLVTTASFVLLLHKLDMRIMAGYEAATDITVSLIVLMVFGGTISGLMIGAFTGLFLSLYLKLYRKKFGYSRFVIEDDEPHEIGFFTLPTKKFVRKEYD